MYRSYSYNNMPEPVAPAPKPDRPDRQAVKEKDKGGIAPASLLSKLTGGIENDDLILLLVIAVLLLNECDDKPLLLALAYIFISDKA